MVIKKDMKYKYLYLILGLLVVGNIVLTYRNVNDWKDYHIADVGKMINVLPVNEDKELVEPEEVRQFVLEMARREKLNVGVVDLVISCESKYDIYARNKASTAKGLAQFLDGTWSNNCKGDVFNAQHNTRCFMDNFKKYPSWWIQCL